MGVDVSSPVLTDARHFVMVVEPVTQIAGFPDVDRCPFISLHLSKDVVGGLLAESVPNRKYPILILPTGSP